MKYLAEYRDPGLARAALAELRRIATKPWSIMEVCGGQTNTMVRQGIDEVLPAGIRMIHGPGCPVCVTPLEQIDRALAIAARPEVIFTSYGDMLRVPGSQTDLLSLRARGATVRVVYSPLQAVELAAANPDRQVVFFAIGFETTAPANAMSVLRAAELGLDNYSVLVSHVLVPPAMRAILASPDNEVQAFLAAGHVCAVMGYTEYEPIAATYQVPIVVTGFEPLDLLDGILHAVRQLESGRTEVENAYARAVARDGNPAAQKVVATVFEVCDRAWRGIGVIPDSGLGLREAYAAFDAERRFAVSQVTAQEHPACIAGSIMRGSRLPTDCSAYATQCTPRSPLGAPMVSTEGTCAAFFAAGRRSPSSLVPAPTAAVQPVPGSRESQS
ncbi:MAG: hydrogenase formation protein HypD [Dactylosporangium sp.]|nr:hydrogenase formation protein HypD [Dactylosporangium sp.]NNJ62698.1 hydrogenase formation protein HypD [Dactylosporangium sp.]